MFNLNIFGREDLTPIRKLLIMHAIAGGTPLNEYEIEGNPASFLTNIAKPLSGLEIPFLPVQSGTGDPSPENVRPISGWTGVNIGHTGENLLGGIALANAIVSSMPSATIDTTNKYVSFASNESTNHIIVGFGFTDPSVYQFKFKENTRYTFIITYSKSTSVSPNIKIAYTDGTSENIPSLSSASAKETVVAVSAEGKTVRSLFKSNMSGTTYVYYEESGIFEGVLTAQDFEEWVGTIYPVTFPAVGKNLLRNETVVRGATSIYIGQSKANEYPVHLVSGEKYTLSFECDGSNTPQAYIQENGGSAVLFGTGKTCTYTAEKTGDYRLYIYVNGGVTEVTDFMLEKGSSASPYEPFTNTVYGGELIVNKDGTGSLYVDHTLNTYDGDEHWDSGGGGFYTYDGVSISVKTGETILCDSYKSVSAENTSPNGMTGDKIIYLRSSYNRLYVKNTDIADLTEFKQSLTTNPIHVYIRITEPQTVTIDPITVQTLIGDNTIWTDTNGSNTIKYKKKG